MSGAMIRAAAVMLLAVSAGCEREARPFKQLPGTIPTSGSQVPLAAGGSPQMLPADSPFQQNAWGINEGKRLFDLYNCAGCHAHGGGGMGPALMDDRWIYGSHPRAIYQTILEGRPNGMPSFHGRIPDAQVWQLVAYVQSMSGQAPLPSLPGRSDHLQPGVSENNRPAETPTQTGSP